MLSKVGGKDSKKANEVNSVENAAAAFDGQLLFNRELAWLEFNRQVLEEAFRDGVPVLERLKFPVDILDQSRRVLYDPRLRT